MTARSDEAERCLIIMENYRHMLVALELPLEPLKKSEERAKIWNDWLKPYHIPTAELRSAFVKGNSLRGDRRSIGVRDVAAGYEQLQLERNGRLPVPSVNERQLEIARLYATAIASEKLTLPQLEVQFEQCRDWPNLKQMIETIITPGGQ